MVDRGNGGPWEWRAGTGDGDSGNMLCSPVIIQWSKVKAVTIAWYSHVGIDIEQSTGERFDCPVLR